MKILCVLGKHNYGSPARGLCYEYVNFLPSLRNLGHEVFFFESFDRSVYRDFADMNRQLLERVQTEKPDVVLCVLLGYEIWLETLQLIREGSGAILINWSTDDSWKYEQFSRYVATAFHLYASTCPYAVAKSRKDGHSNFFLTQWAANSATLAEPLPATQCKYPATFIGTAYGNRSKWISSLAELGIYVECFGFGWPNGPVAAEAIPGIIRDSVVSLNFGDSGLHWQGLRFTRSRQIKARIFEVPGAGGFLLTENAEGLNKFYQIDSEAVTFDNLSDLANKIRFYLKYPAERDKIANAGYARTVNDHRYEIRFTNLLEAAIQKHGKIISSPCSVNMAAFNAYAKKHNIGLGLMLFRTLWSLPFILVWGRTRGSRAARRALFEISWRLAGSKTYSVAGWPGRLFYKES